MNKIVALLLTILFALSIVGCATTVDRYQSFCEQSYYYSTPPTGYYKDHQ